ncbi:MAG: hypothetical protein ABSF23_14050 [Terracidiphilus sp.]|jgi:hypothetical protein
MSRREEWRPVLEAEVNRWSQVPLDRLMDELSDTQAYEVSAGSHEYQVEVELLEDTDAYVRISVAVDDGTLLYSWLPLSEDILRYKAASL